jgi:hypothetical protein
VPQGDGISHTRLPRFSAESPTGEEIFLSEPFHSRSDPNNTASIKLWVTGYHMGTER